MWWPNQDYFNLDKSRVLNAIANQDIREGIFDIWFNRDYTKYAQATGSSRMTLTTWQPSEQMPLYVPKDAAINVSHYGACAAKVSGASTPYQTCAITVAPD